MPPPFRRPCPIDIHDTTVDGETASLPHTSDPKAKEPSVWSVVDLGVLLGAGQYPGFQEG